MKDNEILNVYLSLMDFLEEVLGPETEIVLQDLRKPMHIIDIRNSFDETRVPGGDVSDFAKLVMNDPDKYKGIDYVTNYKGKNTNAYAQMSTSTHMIRNDDENIIGLLCINMKLEKLVELQDMLDGILRRKTRINIRDDSFVDDVLIDVSKVVDDGMSQLSGNPALLTPEAKKQLVANLSDRGLFLVRGAVSEVAKRLDVSEQTIYRYMKESQR